MKQFRFRFFLGSFLVVLGYLICTLLAFLNYRLPYTPTTNWLSDLGNKVLNPSGAIFYNLGLILTAFYLLLFFLGFSVLKTGKNRIQGLMIFLTQIFGVAGAITLALSAFFTIDDPVPHSWVSAGLYICLGTAFAFSVAALRYDSRVPRGLLLLGALAALFDLITSLFFSSVPFFEWITISLFISYLAWLGASLQVLIDKSFEKKNNPVKEKQSKNY